jgi:hypothetical protein
MPTDTVRSLLARFEAWTKQPDYPATTNQEWEDCIAVAKLGAAAIRLAEQDRVDLHPFVVKSGVGPMAEARAAYTAALAALEEKP